MCAENFGGDWRWCALCFAFVVFSSEIAWSQHLTEDKKKVPHAEYGQHDDFPILAESSSSSSSRSSSSSSSGDLQV